MDLQHDTVESGQVPAGRKARALGVLKKICGCLAAVLLTVVCLGHLSDLMQRKSSDFKYQPFFSQEADFDVLFFGTSHVINGIFPMELWQDYGIVSYNFGGHGNTLPVSYWVMRNALEYTEPKLAVIDGYFLSTNTKTGGIFSQEHLSMDSFAANKVKWDAVSDLLDDPVMEENIAQGQVTDAAQRTSMSLMWDFSVYHPRWNELGSGDFIQSYSKEKGAESRIAVSVPAEAASAGAGEQMEGETAGTQYLCRFIETCRERGIEVLLTYLPFPSTADQQKEANRIHEIAKAYGVRYLNFLDMGLVDFKTDCYDPNSHLNPSGARKVTSYLGQYIREHYNIADHRDDSAYRGWADDYAEYEAFKASNLKQQTALDVYLMLLADKNYDVWIEIKDADIWKNAYYTALLENMGINKDKASKNTDAVFVQKAGSQAAYFQDFHNPEKKGKRHRTAQGQVFSYQPVPETDGAYDVCLDGKQQLRTSAEQAANSDVVIAVFKQGTTELVDAVGFSYQGKKDVADDYLVITGAYR